MYRGALVVFEGLDRSGKSTQCKMLLQRLKREGKKVELICFPERSTSIGSILSNYLSNNEELKDNNSYERVSEAGSVSMMFSNTILPKERLIHLLFSANRWEFCEYITTQIYNGVTVLLDRYVYSGIAYTTAKASSISLNWCMCCDAGLPKPDAVLFLTIPVCTLEGRAGYGDELYERKAFQKRVLEQYNLLCHKDTTWKMIDGTLSIEKVHTLIYQYVTNLLSNTGASQLEVLWSDKL